MRWVQLHDRLNIIWNCLSFGLEWKLTYPSTVVADELSKFADILNAAHLQPHSLGILNSSAGIWSPSLAFLVVMLPKAHLTSYSSIWLFTWVTPATSLSQSLWPLLCSSSVHSGHLYWSHLLLLGLWLFCPLLCPSLHEVFLWYLHLVEKSIFFTIVLVSSNSCTIHLWKLSYLSLLFSENLNSIGYIFPFHFAFHFSYFLSYF